MNIVFAIWKSGPLGKLAIIMFALLFLLSLAEIVLSSFVGTDLVAFCEIAFGSFQVASLHDVEVPENEFCELVDRRTFIKSMFVLSAGASLMGTWMDSEDVNGTKRKKAKITLSDVVYADHHPLHEDDTHNPELIIKIKYIIFEEAELKDLTGVMDKELASAIRSIQEKFSLKVDGIIGINTISIIKNNI